MKFSIQEMNDAAAEVMGLVRNRTAESKNSGKPQLSENRTGKSLSALSLIATDLDFLAKKYAQNPNVSDAVSDAKSAYSHLIAALKNIDDQADKVIYKAKPRTTG